MSKLTSAVGIVLIAAGVVASISASHEDVLKANKTLCAKYTKDAELALASKDFNKALKFAKLAIKVDPSNKLGYTVLTKIADAKCTGNAPATSNSAPSNATSTKTQAPAKPAPDEDEDMGC